MTAREFITETKRYEVRTREMFSAGGGFYLMLAGRRNDLNHCEDLAVEEGLQAERSHPTKLIVRGFTAYGDSGSTTATQNPPLLHQQRDSDRISD